MCLEIIISRNRIPIDLYITQSGCVENIYVELNNTWLLIIFLCDIFHHK